MEFDTRTGSASHLRTHCLVVAVHDGQALSPTAAQIEERSAGRLSAILRKGDVAKPGASLLLFDLPGVRAERILLIGTGPGGALDPGRFQAMVRAVAARVKELHCEDALLCLLELEVQNRDVEWKSRQIAELLAHGLHVSDAMKGTKPPRPALRRIRLHVTDSRQLPAVRKALREAAAIAEGVRMARDLGNLPPNVCTPSHMAREARRLARGQDRLSVRVLEEADMRRLGMGAFLAVSRGSDQPAKLVVLQYRGAARASRPYLLLGKGVSFDTGGISLKPALGMHEMTYDMCGAAAVLGTLAAVAQLELRINVVGILAAAENMPGGSATRPGDIVTSLSGQTIEILNTDAEGRLLLCDALTYAARYKPQVVIDVATLTGAIGVALGKHPSGLFSNDDGLATELQAAADRSADRIWRMPLWDDYQEQLKSTLADIKNVGGGRDAGSIIAACFLARFARDYRWAHLDVASTAFQSAPVGATGRPVPLLTQYLLDRSAQTTGGRRT
jgi:leucyl aminopeptidase